MNYKSIQIFQCRYFKGMSFIRFRNFFPFVSASSLDKATTAKMATLSSYQITIHFIWTYNNKMCTFITPFCLRPTLVWLIAMILLMFWKIMKAQAFSQQFWWSITSTFMHCFHCVHELTFFTCRRMDTADGSTVVHFKCCAKCCWAVADHGAETMLSVVQIH